MYEVRIHGRGGQGAVLAGSILAAALVHEGHFVVAVPSFGFERRGAPVTSFLRMDSREIRQMTNIYRPDCVLCIDPTIGRAVNIFDGLRDQGTWIQTTAKPVTELQVPPQVATAGLLDAVPIARELFGRPITNTLMLGAFARTTGLVSLDSLCEAVRESEFRDAGLQQNLQALERGFAATVVHHFNQQAAA